MRFTYAEAMTQALAAGAEHGTTGAAFVTAAVLVLAGMMVIYFGVLRRTAASGILAEDRQV